MFNWSLSNNLTKWGGSPFCWLLQTVEKLLREPAWVAAGLSTNTQSQCQIQTQICKQVNSVADCRLWRNRLCGYNWRPCQPASSDSSSDLSIFLYTIRIAQLGPYYIQLVPLKYFERKKNESHLSCQDRRSSSYIQAAFLSCHRKIDVYWQFPFDSSRLFSAKSGREHFNFPRDLGTFVFPEFSRL